MKFAEMAYSYFAKHFLGRIGDELDPKSSDHPKFLAGEIKKFWMTAQPAPPPSDLSLEIRRQLWLTHGCGFHCLYGDDGEMSCNRMPFIDFRRDSEAEILKGIDSHHWLRIAETQKAAQKETK